LPADELGQVLEENRTLEFGHTFEAQLGGQLRAGFLLSGFFEDVHPGSVSSRYFPAAFATRALKA
jgi:hypothetical protein